MTLLCASPRCRLPGRHDDGCADEHCRGCSRARAADGLNLCPHCTARIGTDAKRSAELDPDLALALIAAGSPGQRGDHGGLSLSDAAMDARTLIRAVLSSWCRLISDERGIHLPGAWRLVVLPSGIHGPANRAWFVRDTVAAMANYIDVHTEWLAAHPAASEAADEMADLARRAAAAAYPSGTRIIEIGRCPAADADEMPCIGRIRALLRTEASLLPSAVACDTDPAHSWGPAEWRSLGRHMAMEVHRVPRLAEHIEKLRTRA
jgi:hypothetical protein